MGVAMAASAACAQITLVADNWCPYNCEPDDELPGVLVEAAKAILGAAGHEVVYQLADDWDVAIEEARAGKFGGIVGAAPEDAPDFLFPQEEVALSVNRLYVRKGDPWRYDGAASLEGKKVVGLTSYSYGDEVDPFMEEHGIWVDTLEEAFEALLGGTADVLLENEYVMSLFAMQNSVLDAVESAGLLDRDFVFVAFSPAIPESQKYADLMTEGMKAMKADGSWNALLDKYGLASP
jgi:polar amino acid transport system substrate-binding protein